MQRLSRAAALVGLPLLLVMTGCSSPAEKAAAAAARYEQSYAAGVYWQARLDMLEAVRLRDDVPAYWLALGRVDMRMNDIAGAYDAYTHAVELEPNNLEALQTLAEIGQASGRRDEANDYADRILKIDPQDPRARLVKGYIAFRRKRYAEAVQWADRLLAEFPQQEGPLILKARSMFELGQHAESIELLEKSLPVSGLSGPKLDMLVQFYQKTNDQEGVERSYGRWLSLAPDDPGLRLGLARQLYRNGKVAGAENILVPMLASGAQSEAAADAMIEYDGKRPTPEMLQQVAAGANPVVVAAAARVALEKGYFDLAMRLMAPYVGGEMTPSVASAAAIFAAAKQGAGQTAEAAQMADRVLAFDEDNPRALRVRAEYELQRRRLDAALKDARILVRDQPADPVNRTLLARIQEARGDSQQAEATFREALNDMPGSKHVLDEFAAFQQRRKRAAPSAKTA